MAEVEAKPLTYIPETILKKRKGNEKLAIERKKQLELGKYELRKKRKQGVADIKRPEDFIKEFRAQELDLIRRKQRVKRPASVIAEATSKLLFVVRIQGSLDMHPKTKKTLYSLRLRKVFSGVFVKETQGAIERLQKVEPYITYGYPNLKNVQELIYKKGYAMIDKKPVPLTDNNIIEQALGKYGIICVEDIIHEIFSVGPHFMEVISFLGPFELNKPEEGLHRKKQRYKDGGDSGHREDEINDLIGKMN